MLRPDGEDVRVFGTLVLHFMAAFEVVRRDREEVTEHFG